MRYLIALLSLISAPAFAVVPVTITFNVPSVAYLTDVESSRFNQIVRPSSEGTLTGALTAAATSMSISGICPAAGIAVMIDQEPILVTAGAGTSTCTITRNSALAQANSVAAAHSSGASVLELVYPTAQKYFAQVGVQNFLTDVIRNLGAGSAVNGTAVSAVLTNQASINSALTGIAQ